jgi:hypothetical protein
MWWPRLCNSLNFKFVVTVDNIKTQKPQMAYKRSQEAALGHQHGVRRHLKYAKILSKDNRL